MLALILSLLGLGGLGGFAYLVGPAAALRMAGSGLKAVGRALASFFRSLNAQGWIGLIVAAVLGFMLLHQTGEARHWKKQSAQFEKLYRAELAHEAKIAKQAVDLKAKIDGLTRNVTDTMKEWKHAEDSRIAGAAGDLRLHGPGKAVCPGYSGASSASGGRGQSGGPGNAAVAQMRDGRGFDLIALPFADTVDFGQSHDGWRAEALTWRGWYRKLVAIWPKPDKPSGEGAKK